MAIKGLVVALGVMLAGCTTSSMSGGDAMMGQGKPATRDTMMMDRPDSQMTDKSMGQSMDKPMDRPMVTK